VSVRRDGQGVLSGVVVFVDPGVWHVWLGGGRVLKTESVEPLAAEVTPELAEVAGWARDFAVIEEGDEVSFSDREGSLLTGTVREKCRYGAVVLCGDGQLAAVGFARLKRKFSPPGTSN
jgi:hypothetical protein